MANHPYYRRRYYVEAKLSKDASTLNATDGPISESIDNRPLRVTSPTRCKMRNAGVMLERHETSAPDWRARPANPVAAVPVIVTRKRRRSVPSQSDASIDNS